MAAVSRCALREGAETSGGALAKHQRGARSQAGEEFLHNAEIALPDDVDAEENGYEENALRQDAGSNEIQVRNIARVHRPAAGEHLPEDEQPKRGLEGAGDEFGEVVAQLAQLKLGDNKRLLDETG